MVFMQRQSMIDHLLSRADLVVRTTNMKISRRSLADYVKNICNKKRVARAARLFLLVQPIRSSICDAVVVVAVVISQTLFVAGQLALIRALIMLLFVFCPQASDFILLPPFRLPKSHIFLRPNCPFKQNFLFLQTSKKLPLYVQPLTTGPGAGFSKIPKLFR